MKRYFSILTLSFCLLYSQVIIAQDTTLFKYIPLKVNNLWVYYGTATTPIGHAEWYDKYNLTSTTQINGKTFFVVGHTRVFVNSYGTYFIHPVRLFQGNIPIRLDSINLNIYKSTNCGSYNVLLVDSLRAKKNDTSSTCDYHGNIVICRDTSLINIFNANRRSKRFEIHAFEGGNSQTYVKDVGVAVFDWHQMMESSNLFLRGCIIEGVLYGDTTFPVGIEKISNHIPDSYKLHQNYPNPFNPSTRIKFSIPPSKGARGMTQLIIYDILGREIATLVNEQLQPGTYEVEWDGSNYPSGVYFYKLITDDFINTKKMVLIK